MQVDSRVSCHGGSEYAKTIFIEAIKRGYRFDVVFLQDLKIPNDIKVVLDRKHKDITELYINGKQELYALIAENDYDVFYSVLPYEYFDYNGNTPIIGVIHGLRNIELPWDKYHHKYMSHTYRQIFGWIFSKLPGFWKLRQEKYKSRLARLINNPKFSFITVSEHSKYALLNFFPSLEPDSISVCYSPMNKMQVQPYTQKSDYYLLVSGNRAEKNIFRAVKAFDKLIDDGRLANRHIIITGVQDPRIFSKIQNPKNLHFLHYVSQPELDQLFRNAYCFVYPSLNEGFGYPPLQAMKYGTPIIASSATSIPEVCKAAALYFSPTSIDDLCNRILQIEYSPSTYANIVNAGQRRIKELMQMQEQSLNTQLNMIFSSDFK